MLKVSEAKQINLLFTLSLSISLPSMQFSTNEAHNNQFSSFIVGAIIHIDES